MQSGGRDFGTCMIGSVTFFSSTGGKGPGTLTGSNFFTRSSNALSLAESSRNSVVVIADFFCSYPKKPMAIQPGTFWRDNKTHAIMYLDNITDVGYMACVLPDLQEPAIFFSLISMHKEKLEHHAYCSGYSTFCKDFCAIDPPANAELYLKKPMWTTSTFEKN